MPDSALYTYVATALVAVLFYRWRFANFYDIPTIGPSLPVVSYLGAYRFLRDNKAMIQEGYQKFKGGVFKVAMLDRWLIVISGPKLIDEVRKLPDDQVSFVQGLEEFLQLHHSFGHDVISDPVHVDVVRDHLTRHIAAVFDDLREETVLAFNDLVPVSGDDWTSVDGLRTMIAVVARVSSRIFVGLPLCHNKEYLELAVNHTLTIGRTREILTYFPEAIKPLVSLFLTEGRQGNVEGKKFLAPMIQKRLDEMAKFGDDWSDKPDDMLQWIIDLTVQRGKGLDEAVRYMMLVNFAAIHTSSNSFTQALYHLAAKPEYMKPLREEVESIINEEGWTKSAMQRLKKVDSFMRESLRMNGIDGLSLTRKALKDVTLSNGTLIPAGSLFVAASASTHLDPENYDDATVFNPWRFSEMRDREGGSTRHQFVTTSVDYIPFGHGKHACPGRFFAANELKGMFAHIIMNYDVKLQDESWTPENVWFANAIVPNPTIKVLFRKRQD